MSPKIACIDLVAGHNVPEVVIHRPSHVEPRPLRSNKEEDDVHRQCDIFLTVLIVLAMVGYLYNEWAPVEKDSQDTCIPDGPDPNYTEYLRVPAKRPTPALSKIMERLARAEASFSEATGKDSNGLSEKLKILIRETVAYSSNYYAERVLEIQVIEILETEFGSPALGERRSRVGHYHQKFMVEWGALEALILTTAQDESVCLPEFRKFVDKTCQNYQERYGRPAHSCEDLVSLTEMVCGLASGQDSPEKKRERARRELRQMIGETNPLNGEVFLSTDANWDRLSKETKEYFGMTKEDGQTTYCFLFKTDMAKAVAAGSKCGFYFGTGHSFDLCPGCRSTR